MAVFISLFDYLGHAAGSDLGKQVAEYGSIRKTQFGRKDVKTKKYTGEVLTYTKDFLDEFFRAKALFEGAPQHDVDEVINRQDQIDLVDVNSALVEDAYKPVITEGF